MSNLVERYNKGEYREVWRIITSSTAIVVDSDFAKEVEVICRELMLRVRTNVILLVARLEAIGYEFVDASSEARERITRYHEVELIRFRPPLLNVLELINELESREGQVPLALKLFYECVGSVNLCGKFPSTSQQQLLLDPLQINPLDMVLEMQPVFRESEEEEQCPFPIPVAPDKYFKEGLSGGSTYAIEIPDKSVDPILLHEPHHMTFVEYLRNCFSCGGFPGIEDYRRNLLGEYRLNDDLLEF